MEYSKLQTLKVRNFRQLGEVDIDFDTPIITIMGENDAGKTSLMLALGVVGLNAHSSKQKKYIKRGKQAFGLSLSLEDGTEIKRIKSGTQNSLQVYQGSEALLDLTKIDNPSVPPQELEAVMGLLKDQSTGEILNIRTYKDRLIFADTTGGDNYKIIYEVLKVSNLVRAIRKGNEESSGYKKQINTNATIMEHIIGQLRSLKQVDIEPLSLIKQRLQAKQRLYNLVEQAKDKQVYISKFNGLALAGVDSLNVIDHETLSKIGIAQVHKGVVDRITSSEGLKEYHKIRQVDQSLIGSAIKMQRALQAQGIITNIKVDGNQLNELEPINITQLVSIAKAQEIYAQVKASKVSDIQGLAGINTQSSELITKAIGISKALAKYNTDLQEKQAKIYDITAKIKASGIAYKVCNNCGEVVIIE